MIGMFKLLSPNPTLLNQAFMDEVSLFVEIYKKETL